MNESVRIAQDGENRLFDREKIKIVQTPQVFDAMLIKKAYQQNFNPAFTDDASVLEAMGEKINLIGGNAENIKITQAIDLKKIAAILLAGRQ